MKTFFVIARDSDETVNIYHIHVNIKITSSWTYILFPKLDLD